MFFQLLFEIFVLAFILMVVWKMLLKPRAESYIRGKENNRLKQKMEELRQKKSDLEDLQAERDVTKELRELEKEVLGVQKELDRLDKKVNRQNG